MYTVFYMKRWYFAARIRHQEKIAELTRFLEIKNELVMSDWVFQYPKKPFHEHVAETQTMASSVVDSLLQTDIFVLISDAEGTDMFVELGIIIANQKLHPEIRIYIVGEHNKRSLMQMYPSIIHVDHLEEIFEKEHIDNYKTISLDF